MTNPVVEMGLRNITDGLTSEIPEIREIRVFGSYNNDRWDRNGSDVDVFVYVDDDRVRPYTEQLVRRMNLGYKYHIFVYDSSSIEGLRTYRERGDMIKAMKNGRLLYKRNQVRNFLRNLISSLFDT